MIVGVIRAEFYFPHARSLKEKRKEVKSIKERLRSSFNVSVSEIDNHDLWQRATIGISFLGGETSFVQEVLDKVMDVMIKNWSHFLVDVKTEFLKV